jgi:hypothetical protein
MKGHHIKKNSDHGIISKVVSKVHVSDPVFPSQIRRNLPARLLKGHLAYLNVLKLCQAHLYTYWKPKHLHGIYMNKMYMHGF